MQWDRSKSKAYTKQKDALEDVALELSCHSDPKIVEMQGDVDKKVEAMIDVLKSYKKLVFMAEAELKKDCLTNPILKQLISQVPNLPPQI